MKVLMIFDQIQAGMGGKENAHQALGGKMIPIGSASMLEPALKAEDGKIVATIYCGDAFFAENEEEVTRKVVGMTKKINPDVVICGPAFNYKGYAAMSAKLAKAIEANTDIPAVAAMSQENDETIAEFKDSVNIVKMPKKGGIGLNDSLRHICQLAHKKVNKENIEDLVETICY